MSSRSAASSLVVPELINGSWTSAVILTFGANLSFFESSILRQLSQIPLRAILADGRRLDAILSKAAETGVNLRMVNRAYLVAPLRHARAAHAKAIILLGAESGQLIVGSGNLGQDGYGTAGELWHLFRFQDQSDTQHLAEFVAVRDLIDEMAANGVIDPPTVDFMETVWSKAPWLPSTHEGDSSVRHNFEVPLIAQLAGAVTWPVEELTVHAPFHDPDSAALAALITQFRPKTVRVLLSRATSVDTSKLAQVMASAPRAKWLLAEVEDDAATYIHAKWVHLVGANNEALLTGSANLSRSALLRASNSGNIEIGVISRGVRGEFSDLYKHLTLSPITDIASLNLSYAPTSVDDLESRLPRTSWSRLDGTKLTLAFDRAIDGMQQDLRVFSTNGEVTPTSVDVDGKVVTLNLTKIDAALIAEGGFITVQFGDVDSEASETWPYQLSALRARLDRAGEREMLPHVGSLPEKDADLYALLRELEETLIFDPVSTWRVAKPNSGSSVPTEDGGESSRWEDLDWARVRRDPRYSGYFALKSVHANPSDIQVVLAAIGGRLGGLGVTVRDERDEDESDLALEGDVQIAADDEVEGEEFDDVLQQNARPISARTRMAFNRFIVRYTRATQDEAFVNALGPIVGASNAAIFNHLLMALMERDAVDIAKARDAQVALWALLWGRSPESGLLRGLADEERQAVEQVLSDAHVRQTTLRALAGCHGRELASQQRADLRAIAQHLILDESFGLDSELIESVRTVSGSGTGVLRDLEALASLDTGAEVAETVLSPLGVAASRAKWRIEDVSRTNSGAGSRIRADVLVVSATVPGLTHALVREALERLAVEARLAGLPCARYLRIRFEGNGSDVGFWDVDASEGVAMVNRDDQEIESLDPPWPAWLLRLEELARGVSRALV
jgi:hypothetical protein